MPPFFVMSHAPIGNIRTWLLTKKRVLAVTFLIKLIKELLTPLHACSKLSFEQLKWEIEVANRGLFCYYELMKTNTQTKTRIHTSEDAKHLRYPLPESWKKAAGMLKHKKVNALAYQKRVRAEWDQRFKKLEKRART